MERLTAPLLEWGVASRPFEPGESGDTHLVHPIPHGTLIAVIDGLGHGHEAATASRTATRLLTASVSQPPLVALRMCHAGLRETRGVCLALAWFDGAHDIMTWLGVGDVQGLLLRRDAVRPEHLVGHRGVVGRQLPALHAGLLVIARGDLLVFATDGIRPGYTVPAHDQLPPQQIADAILDQHRTGSDDALVLVARYRGPEA